ncbi:GNAT family N-acetyltransferase [Ligilactobacillus pobuzihii]|uniref:GNAT family N-acetyltransferase n=1 Tax=Ligilactobacillus pobuzihii TaxID=449659 RepID=UPI001ED2097F|nr:GNAT family N-acetyltransferase [Ligilactobacillus pobuzihii]MBN7274759.1 GNAT family N-acetyltransferase [Ligilactobacillus pobuzihii]
MIKLECLNSSKCVKLLQEISCQTFFETFGPSNTCDDVKNYLANAFCEKKLLKEIDNDNSYFYIALEGNCVIGYVKVNINSSQTEQMGANYLEVQRIYVKNKYKNKGVGTLLFNKALEIAYKNQKNRVWLGVWPKNYSALKFYKKLGFKKIGKHIFTLGSKQQVDLIMELIL